MTTPEKSLAMSMASHLSWARTIDRSSRTSPARAAFDERILAEAEGDPARANNLRKAYFKALALKSVQARRRLKEATEEEEAAEAELDDLNGRGDV